MSISALENNISYQEKINKERIKKLKEWAKEYKAHEGKLVYIRTQIADLCLKMIKMGISREAIFVQMGGHKDNQKSRLAFSIKSLYRWIRDREAELKLTENNDISDKRKELASRLADKIPAKATPRQARSIFNKEVRKHNQLQRLCPEDRHLLTMVKSAKDMEFYICNNYILKGLDQEQLSNLHESIKQIKDGLDNHFGTKSVKKKKVQRKKVSKRSSAKVDLKVVS